HVGRRTAPAAVATPSASWPSAVRVLLVGDVVEPGHDLTLFVRFLDRDVGHEPVGGRAVPVLFVRLACGEPNVGAADRGLVVGVADAVDVDGAGEPVLRADRGLPAALGELHVRVLLSLITGAAAP